MPHRLSRRAFIAGASATAIAACGSGKSASPASPSSSASGAAQNVLVTFSDSSALVPGSPQRLTFGIADKDGVVISDPPSELDFAVSYAGQNIGPPIRAASHIEGLPRPYYPVVFTPASAGIYTVTASLKGVPLQAPVQIPGSTGVIGPGQPMVPLDTPTTADQRGVELLCTRKPACDLHDITLREALGLGTPVAFLIGTPQFCQTAICGPVLDVLLGQKSEFPQVKMLHAEVYPSEADAQPGQQKLTEAVEAYHLSFEPVLYLANAAGTVVDRIDTIFDAVELHDALVQLTG